MLQERFVRELGRTHDEQGQALALGPRLVGDPTIFQFKDEVLSVFYKHKRVDVAQAPWRMSSRKNSLSQSGRAFWSSQYGTTTELLYYFWS